MSLVDVCSRVLSMKDERVRFDVQSIYTGHHRVEYRGVAALRCPFDYVIYQMLINKLRPDLVIEIGTNHGGGALYLADLLGSIGEGMVHTIDIKQEAAAIVKEHPRIRLYAGGWEEYDLKATSGFSRIMVIEDSSHLYGNTLAVLEKFSPIVTVGSYFVVEDGIITRLGLDKEYDGGPLRAVREFLHSNHDFTVDRYWCDFFGTNATFNVNGYLKRVK